jgi:hypothetical protein
LDTAPSRSYFEVIGTNEPVGKKFHGTERTIRGHVIIG